MTRTDPGRVAHVRALAGVLRDRLDGLRGLSGFQRGVLDSAAVALEHALEELPAEEPEEQPAKTLEPGKEHVLPLVALRETVIFPEMIVPLQVGRAKSVEALNRAVAGDSLIALVTQRQAEREEIEDPSELYPVGTLAKIAQVVQLQDGTVRAIVQGQQRLRLVGFDATAPALVARIETVAEGHPEGVEVQALVRTVQGQIEQYVQSGAPVPPGAAVAARNITEPGLLADMVARSEEQHV